MVNPAEETHDWYVPCPEVPAHIGHTWQYVDILNAEPLKPVLAEANRNVEHWTGVCKQMGRDVDDFCRREMKRAKKELKAAEWLRKYWDAETTLRTMPHELATPIQRFAHRVIYA